MYRERIYDNLVKARLEAKGAALVEGAKWCGKTTTCAQIANSSVYFSDPTQKQQYLDLLKVAPAALLEGAVPRLFDEWQLAPQLWDAIRFTVDKRNMFGQFLLTGSAVPADFSEVTHTGTGRIARVRMRPMSLFESGESSGEVSLKALFNEGFKPVKSPPAGLSDIAFAACRGGWPAAVNVSATKRAVALEQAFDYVDAVSSSDISAVDGISRNPQLAKALLRSLARFSGSAAKNTELLKDIAANYSTVSDKTLSDYLSALEKSFVTENLSSWNPNLRSKAAIRTSAVRHFTDPSIAAAALGADPAGLIHDIRTLGLLFETLCVRDLRVYADTLRGAVSHYRDSNGLECDAVVHLRGGQYGLVEIKLGGDENIEKGVATLKKLAATINTDKMGTPEFLMVLTAIGEYAYRREDGIIVCPIKTLGP